MRVFQERQYFDQWWLWLILIISLGAFLYAPSALIIEQSDVSVKSLSASFWISLAVLIAVHIFFALCHLNTEIYENGIAYQFYPFHFNPKRMHWKDLSEVYVRKYRPISEYGGWGYRMGFGGRALNVKGNKGVQLKFKNGKKLLIGTQRPEEAQQIIDKYFKNERI
jgi:hypothetical protein